MKLDDDDDELLLLLLNKNDALKEAIGGLFFSRDIRNREWVEEEEEEEEEGRLLVARAVAATAVVGELLVANTDADIWLDSVCLVNARGSSECFFLCVQICGGTEFYVYSKKVVVKNKKGR